jgi:hypothetical protein
MSSRTVAGRSCVTARSPCTATVGASVTLTATVSLPLASPILPRPTRRHPSQLPLSVHRYHLHRVQPVCSRWVRVAVEVR